MKTQITRDDPLFIVLNAGSGHASAEVKRTTIQDVLQAAGQRHEIFVVENAHQLLSTAQRAVELAQQQQGVVVAAGGDGTLRAVAQLVLPHEQPFGVLPQGTFNYFGRAHGIPTDMAEATQALLQATVQPVQVGMVNQQVFLVNASLGLYSQVFEDREVLKKRFGRSQFIAIVSALATLLREHRQLLLRLEYEEKTRLMRVPTLVVGNNQIQLERLGIPEVQALRQRRLIAITVPPLGTLAVLWLLFRGALGQLGEAENVTSFTFQRLTIQLGSSYRRRYMKVAIDGEVTRMIPPLVFEVAATPLWLLTPPREAARGGAG